MNRLFLTLASFPLVYLTIAATLVLLPVERREPDSGLDFGGLDFETTSEVPAVDSAFTVRDGKSIYYREVSGKSGIVVALLHGSGTEGRYLVPLASELNSLTGATVVIPDLRGHGRSAESRQADVDYLGQYEDDLEDIYLALRLEHPNSRLILGGHSSGGGLAVKYGGNTRSEFDGYLLLAPYLGYQAPTVRLNSGGWVQVAQRRYAGLAMLNNVGITGLNDYPVLFFNRPKEFDDEFQADSYSYRLNESFSPQNYSENLKSITKPMLALVGEDDEAVFAERFEDVLSKDAPHAHLNLIVEAGHLSLPTNSTVAELIAKWIEQEFR